MRVTFNRLWFVLIYAIILNNLRSVRSSGDADLHTDQSRCHWDSLCGVHHRPGTHMEIEQKRWALTLAEDHCLLGHPELVFILLLLFTPQHISSSQRSENVTSSWRWTRWSHMKKIQHHVYEVLFIKERFYVKLAYIKIPGWLSDFHVKAHEI